MFLENLLKKKKVKEGSQTSIIGWVYTRYAKKSIKFNADEFLSMINIFRIITY